MQPIELRPFQKETLALLESKNHVVLSAPTGSGKSLIFYRFIEKNRNVRALMIVPLVALARQQAERMSAHKIRAHVGSGRFGDDPESNPAVWILNPESLTPAMMMRLQNWKPNLLIVDEAHCVFEWGSDFRPEFKKVLELVSELKIKKSLWCSATLTQSHIDEIKIKLPAAQVSGKFSFPESLQIERLKIPTYRRLQFLFHLLKSSANASAHRSGIIFCSTRKSTERLSRYLKEWGLNPVSYHAGLSREERCNLERQVQFHQKRNEPIVVVATSAFGMGMDYPSLSFCVLYEPPLGLTALAQAIGRVGRSKQISRAYALYSEDDFLNFRWFTETAKELVAVARKRQLQYVKEWYQTAGCHRRFLEKYFNDPSF